MDFATILGLISGFALLAMAILLGGTPGAFIDAPSVLIVFGGTFAVTAMSHSIKEIIRVPKVALQALLPNAYDPTKAASHPLATRSSSSPRDAPNPARLIRWAIKAMSSLPAIVAPFG